MATASHVSTDPAFETSFFWEHYKWAIIGAVALLVVAGLGYTGYLLYTARQATNAANALAAAHTVREYEQVIEHYPASA